MIAGEVDADRVANSLTEEQILEWWAFGAMNGWFPIDEERKGMTPEQSEAIVAKTYG